MRTSAPISNFVPLISSDFDLAMTDDLNPFESPKLLIDGAKTSIVDFKAACDGFVQNCTYDIIDHINPNTGDKIIKLRFHHRMPPKMRIPASHIVNDLRHSLDQAVCDGAVALGRPNAKGVYFPFGKTAKDLDDEVVNRCKNVNAELVAFVRKFNSHYGGDDLLYALGSLAGPNKHQRILGISLSNAGVQLGGSGQAWSISSTGGFEIGGNKWNDLRNELEFARFGRGTTGNIDARPVIQIVLGTGEPPLSDPAPTVLDTLASKVEGIVLGIEAETSRILRAKAI
jgi:hypothetical protein